MSSLPVRLIVKNYDHVAPLACGDVAPEGIELDLVRDTIGALPRTVNDRSFGAGEHSLSRHVLRLANGDRSFVGIPIFPVRNFRHRCFWVRRDSDIRTLEDLAGRRVGTDEWSATGNVWSRAALRDVGVESDQIEWLVGPVDGSAWREWSALPPFARFVEEGQDLHAMLLAGEIDAIVCPNPPSGVLEPGSPVVRLVPDYRDVEHSYFGRLGYYPAHHLMGVRRELYEREPWVLRSLYTAFEASKQLWLKERRHLGDTTPWLLADIEETMGMMGRDWQANGIKANVAMTQGLCDEQLAQGVLSKPFDARELFAEFEEVMGQ